MMGARELLPVFFSYCRRMLRAFLLVALGGATLFVVTILYRAPLELPLYTCCLLSSPRAKLARSGYRVSSRAASCRTAGRAFSLPRVRALQYAGLCSRRD